MKARLIAFLFLSFSVNCFSQNEKLVISINGGVQQTRSDNYLVLNSDEGDYPLSLKPGYGADFNVLFNLTTGINRLGLLLGYGFNRKGIVQKGMMADGTPRYYPYTIEFYENYLDAFVGFSYKLINQKKWSLSVSQVFSPEVDMGSIFTSGTYIKKYVPATRSSVALTFNINQRLGLQLTGFYQTALDNYFDPNGDYRKKPIYRPYSFGVNVGLIFF